MQNKVFFLIILSISLIGSTVSAETFGYGRTEDVPINYSLIPTVNASEYWITSIGDLDNADATQHNNVGGVLTIDETYLESFGSLLWCELTGCTMGGDINMSGYHLTTSFLNGIVGAIDMRGDPWYLSGTDFRLAGNLIVDENITASNYFIGDFLLNSTHIIDHDGHSIKDTFNHISNRGVAEEITVSLTGGLNVEWTAGEVYDASIENFVKTDAGSGTLVSDQVNYLKYTGTSTLELQTSSSTGDEILVARFANWNGIIAGYRETSLISESMANTRRGLRLAFPNRIISGMSVSEDEDATNDLDVSMDAGVLVKDGTEEVNPTAINSRTLSLVRLFHSGGDWTNDSNAEIDTLQYDNGTDLVNIPANKWVKAYFIYAHHEIGFVYPTAYYNTKAQAEEGALSPIPEGLTLTPKLTTVIYQQGDTDFDNAEWQDVRPGISEESFSVVSNYGSLAGLPDLSVYLLADGSRSLTGEWNVGNNITNVSYGDFEMISIGNDGAPILATGTQMPLEITGVEASIRLMSTDEDKAGGVNLYNSSGDLKFSFQYGGATQNKFPNQVFFGARAPDVPVIFIFNGTQETARIKSDGDWHFNQSLIIDGNITTDWITSNNQNTTNIYTDHIAEKTTGHDIVIDNDVDLGNNKLKFTNGEIYTSGPVLHINGPAIWSIDFDGVAKYNFQPTVLSPTIPMSGLVDLGGATAQFKDLYLAGKIDLGTNTITDGSMTGDWDLGSGNLTTTGNITADTYFGDGQYLTGTGNSSWNETYAKTIPELITTYNSTYDAKYGNGDNANFSSLNVSNKGIFGSIQSKNSLGVFGSDSIAMGLDTNASGDGSIAVGTTLYSGEIVASGDGAMAVGYARSDSMSFGKGSIISSGLGSIAMGYVDGSWGAQQLVSSGKGSIAVGNRAKSTGEGSISMGYDTLASNLGAMALGSSTNAIGQFAMALGFDSIANSTTSIAMGSSAWAKALNAISLGKNTQALGVSSIAMGYYAYANKDYSTAIGKTVTNNIADSFAVGFGKVNLFVSNTDAYVNVTNAFTIYNGSGYGLGIANEWRVATPDLRNIDLDDKTELEINDDISIMIDDTGHGIKREYLLPIEKSISPLTDFSKPELKDVLEEMNLTRDIYELIKDELKDWKIIKLGDDNVLLERIVKEIYYPHNIFINTTNVGAVGMVNKLEIAKLNQKIDLLKTFQQDICKEQNSIYNKYDWCEILIK